MIPTKMSKRESKYIQWMFDSVKAKFISNPHDTLVLSDLQHAYTIMRPAKRQNTIHEMGFAKRARTNRLQYDEDTQTHTIDTNTYEAFTRSFEADMLRYGKIWLLEDEPAYFTVVWNACEPDACELSSSQFSTTTFYKEDDAHFIRGTCDNCTIFKSAISSRDHTELLHNGRCPHLAMRDVAMRAVDKRQSASSTQLETFLRKCFDATLPVSLIQSSATKCQYFVVVPKTRAEASGLNSRHGVVTIEVANVTGEVFVSCGNTLCRRRDRKVMKHPREFCPHFDTLWRDVNTTNQIRLTLGIHSWGLSESVVHTDTDERHVPLDNDMVIECQTGSSEPATWETSVEFNTISGTWEPAGCKTHVIPMVQTEFIALWAQNRSTGRDLVRDPDGLLVWYKGTLQSDRSCGPLEVNTCTGCGSHVEKRDDDVVLIRTFLGCVRRSRFKIVCCNSGMRIHNQYTLTLIN